MNQSVPPVGLAAALAALSVSVVVVFAPGCAQPLERTTRQALRDELKSSHAAYLEAISAGPVVELSRPVSDVTADLSDERRDELNAMSGPTAYQDQPLEVGENLLGEGPGDRIQLSLQQAVRMAVENNIDLRVSRMGPAIDETRITQAEANFDAVFFTDASLSLTDQPRPQATAPGAPASLGGSQQRDDFTLTTGVRKQLYSGGQISFQTEVNRLDENPSLFATAGGFKFYNASVSATITQPLLRNFGEDVNRTQILLARNSRQTSVEDLRESLLRTLFETERAYWNLVLARQRLLIQQRLLERGGAERDRVKERVDFDASPVEVTQANSTLSERRSNVIVAKQQLRQASDRLKRLINSPRMPLTGEALIDPTDDPVDMPVRYSLLDAVTTALQHRPAIQQALLSIDDATLRKRFADNQRLPELNLSFTLRYNGLGGDDAGDAYDDLSDLDFIDYILQANFEVPIGNRGPEARYRQRSLERQAAVLSYRRSVQDVVLEVKNALRELLSAYELIGTTRATRMAAADNLRAIEEQEAAGVALTPEFLDFKLRRQEALAVAEVNEIQAVTQYNTAIANYYRVLGTLLKRNQIEFDPTFASVR